jgi:hypothetical protein
MIKGEPTINHPNLPPSQYHFARLPTMKADARHVYRVQDLTLFNVIVPVMKCLSDYDMQKLRLVCRLLQIFVPKVIRLSSIDFMPLQLSRLDYRDQKQVSKHRIDMAGAAMIFYNNDPGMVVRCINIEYRGAWRDIDAILTAIDGLVTKEDYEDIKRILLEGAPANLNFWETTESKMEVIGFGNQRSYTSHPEITRELLNKEDKHSHLLPMDESFCEISPYLRHNSQGVVIRADHDPRQVWDSSTQITPMMTVMNNITNIEDEAEITFGATEPNFLALIYNLRVEYPTLDILLAMADVKACFRFPRIHPDLTGAFGFYVIDAYCLATAMVFGSNTSATSWEPFRRAIENLSKEYQKRPELVEKHSSFFEMIKWNTSEPTEPLVRAHPCPLNPAVWLTLKATPE